MSDNGMFQAIFFDAAGTLIKLRCLHIGDDPYAGHKGARDAGLQSFLLNRPHITLATLVENLAAG